MGNTPAEVAFQLSALDDVPRPADYHRLARLIAKGGEAAEALAPVRLAALASFTLEFVRPFLTVEGARLGLHIETDFGAFGQFEQALAATDTPVYEFRPDALLLVIRPEDLAPDAVTRFGATGGEAFRQLTQDIAARVETCVSLFRARSDAPVLVANFATPAQRPFGPLDANMDGSLTYAVAEANVSLRQTIASLPNVFMWDYAGLVHGQGAETWTDRRLWLLGRIGVAAEHQPALGRHLARTLAAVRRPPAKCLVLDLDNTIWGGVIGDDGMEGIQLGDDFPGNAFKEFQRHVLALLDRGILLAVASKNEADVAEAVFRDHPEMLIRWDDLAAARINWGPKSESLRAIARELNIGADQLVFFDDNPVERAEVRLQAPEVLVIDPPTEPWGYVRALTECGFFDQITVSGEDRERSTMYRQQRARKRAEQQHHSPEDFLASLDMVAEVGEVNDTTLARITQLIGKTNQFNLTTRRHGQAEIVRFATADESTVLWLRLRDRFGDQGLVGVAIVVAEGIRARIDTLLMSCRVMNRQVEHALLAYVAEHARRLGCSELLGEYRPTKKNSMVASLFPEADFAPAAHEPDHSTFTIDLGENALPWPTVIQRAPTP